MPRLDVWVLFWVLVWLLCLVAASFSCLLVGPFREMLGTTVGCLGAVWAGAVFDAVLVLMKDILLERTMENNSKDIRYRKMFDLNLTMICDNATLGTSFQLLECELKFFPPAI